jgi:hypothetical protein
VFCVQASERKRKRGSSKRSEQFRNYGVRPLPSIAIGITNPTSRSYIWHLFPTGSQNR